MRLNFLLITSVKKNSLLFLILLIDDAPFISKSLKLNCNFKNFAIFEAFTFSIFFYEHL